MQAAALPSAASEPKSSEPIETLGLQGATLMQLWSIGVASISDLTAYDTEALRQELADAQKGVAGSRERIEKMIADIHAALVRKNSALKPEKKTETKIEVKRELPAVREQGFEPDHEWLDKANQSAPLLSRDPLEHFYRDVRKYKPLSREEMTELGRRVLEEKDMAARDLLVLHNLRLVLWVARKFMWGTRARKMEWSGLDFSDLIQEGILGLMIAAERYDYRQGFTFGTYAPWWIRQTISRTIQDSGFIRIPVHLQELLHRIRRAMNEIAIREGRPPTIAEVATAIEEEPKKIRSALKVAQMQNAFVSIDEPTASQRHSDGEEEGMYELIADETVLRADRFLEAKEELDGACKRLNDLTEALYKDETISERNREIFARFYGLDGSLQRRILEHVAEGYDMTRERVRQIIEQCWDKLQHAGFDMDHDSVVDDLKRIRELEKVTHKRVSAT